MIFFMLLLVQLSIFGGLIFLLRFLLKRHIGSASSRLELLTQEHTQKLADAKRRMDEANAYYGGVLVKAKEDAELARQQLISEGIKAKEEMIEQARKQGDEVVERAQTAADIMKQQLEQKIDEESAKKAYQVIHGLLPGKMGEETHAQWVRELLKNGFDRLNRLHVPDDVKDIKVISAFPLKPAEKTLLISRLKESLGREVKLSEQVDPDLILGICFTIGNVVIDGTLRYQAQEALKHAPSTSG